MHLTVPQYYGQRIADHMYQKSQPAGFGRAKIILTADSAVNRQYTAFILSYSA